MRVTRHGFVRIGLATLLLAAGACWALESPPATTQTQPATAPSAAGTSQVIKKGRLALRIDAAGTFLPTNPVEIRFRPEAYKGDLEITSAAPNGAAVHKGDPLL